MGPQGNLFDADTLAKHPNSNEGGKRKKGRRSKEAPELSRSVQFLTIDEVKERYRISQATVWRWVKQNEHFPPPVQLSPGTSRWSEDQLIAFENRARSRQSDKRSKTGQKAPV